ncbi:hypothetical protein CkaCkLH20_12986 [Colletotrichum karsti]|uniref:Uncharacterized protein n=1 Tax=Colletotrichum karsti TaxID=1095194 RepID=A0A9P6LDU7_9PEZI|nr:uncharacterized protein CkaCkLH20_12986 [Colletotrichum karsti]KAF9869593.1 hypothetical protein CkaCkLH20_12986 [Colletotrichum karsti]
MEPTSQAAPADVTPPSDASPANLADRQPQGEAGVELQRSAQPQPQTVQSTSPQTTPARPQSPRPQARTDAPAQHRPGPPIDERDIFVPMPAPTTHGEAEAGVRRKLPMSGLPTAAELDESVTFFHRYFGLYFLVAPALETPTLPTIVLKVSSRLNIS